MNNYISKIYNQLTGKTIQEAILAFNQLVIHEARTGDLFFETYGVPNTIEAFNAPYERFICYEALMQAIKNEDSDKFSLIHKGTPYYFLGWSSFEIRNYSKAVFYMDLALGEDIRKSTNADPQTDALTNPGGNLWKLIPEGPAVRVIQQLKEVTTQRLLEFGIRTSEVVLLDDFVTRFVVASITQDARNRSLISSLYCYLLESKDLYETLKIRSQNISSIEPFLDNLFKGGLIFESLLKAISDQRSWTVTSGRGQGNPPRTLEAFRRCNDFLALFGIAAGNFITSAPDLSTILVNAGNDTIETSLSITAQLRNTTGHDLRRDDIFQNPDDFLLLANKELNALFYVAKIAFI